MRHRCVALVLVAAAACSSSSGEGSPDAAAVDAAAADAGAADAASDAGAPDGAPADAGTADAAAPDAGAADGAQAGYFPDGAVWTQDIRQAHLDSESALVIGGLGNAGWGNNGVFQIDFSIEVLTADASAPMRAFQKTSDFFSPDCDFVQMPVPAGGALEGETGYACTHNGDCHLIVVHQPTRKLYEMWRADLSGSAFRGGCLAVWDLTRIYPPYGRGEGCTSADAAGYPIAPLLFDADEVEAGHIDHAIRFVLPNDRIRAQIYVHPATHSTGPTSGGADTPPYGAHLRLRANYPLDTLPNDGARTVARSLQKYGMFLADGGEIALTARSDRSTKAKWSGLLGPRDLADLRVADFEMVEGGERFTYTDNCVRQ